jgi:hypothetical protein
VRRFGHVLHLIDKAEGARRVTKTRRLLERIAQSLGKVNNGVQRDGERGRLSAECVTAVDAMLADSQGRAERLAVGF